MVAASAGTLKRGMHARTVGGNEDDSPTHTVGGFRPLRRELRDGLASDGGNAHREAVRARIAERKKSILYGWDDDVTPASKSRPERLTRVKTKKKEESVEKEVTFRV